MKLRWPAKPIREEIAQWLQTAAIIVQAVVVSVGLYQIQPIIVHEVNSRTEGKDASIQPQTVKANSEFVNKTLIWWNDRIAAVQNIVSRCRAGNEKTSCDIAVSQPPNGGSAYAIFVFHDERVPSFITLEIGTGAGQPGRLLLNLAEHKLSLNPTDPQAIQEMKTIQSWVEESPVLMKVDLTIFHPEAAMQDALAELEAWFSDPHIDAMNEVQLSLQKLDEKLQDTAGLYTE